MRNQFFVTVFCGCVTIVRINESLTKLLSRFGQTQNIHLFLLILKNIVLKIHFSKSLLADFLFHNPFHCFSLSFAALAAW